MAKTLPLLACSFLLALGGGIALSQRLSSQQIGELPRRDQTRSHPEKAVPIYCQGVVPPALQSLVGDYLVAQKSDFVESIRQLENDDPTSPLTCGIFSADLNQDGQLDYALMLVHPQQKLGRFLIAIQQKNGEFKPAVQRDFLPLKNNQSGVLYSSMQLKPAGKLGAAARDYAPLKPGSLEQKTYQGQVAIERWKAIALDEAGLPQGLEASTLGYCSEAFYGMEGELQTFTVCD